MSGAEAVEMVADAIAYTREKGAAELLVNVYGLAGFASPNIMDRFLLAEKWTLAAGGRVRVALVDRAERIHPHKFGVMVAANRGAVFDVFATEAEALAWLDGGAGTAQAQAPQQ